MVLAPPIQRNTARYLKTLLQCSTSFTGPSHLIEKYDVRASVIVVDIITFGHNHVRYWAEEVNDGPNPEGKNLLTKMKRLL